MTNIFETNLNCSRCNKAISRLEIFPGDLCPDCWEAKTANDPIIMPDFTKVLNITESEVINK